MNSCLLLAPGAFALLALATLASPRAAWAVPVALALCLAGLAWSLWLAQAISRQVRSLRRAARSLVDGGSAIPCADGAFRELAAIGRSLDRVRKLQGLARLGFDEKVRQAREAVELAEKSASTKAQFLAYMSHELRTPLTAILGYCELLLEDDIAIPERREYTQVVVRSGRHLLTVLNDILDLSKLEAGRMSIEPLEVVPWELVDGVMTLFRERAQHKGIGFDVEYAAPIPALIETDPTRVRQVLMNLLSNAIKFTSEGGVRVVVSMLQQSDLSRPLMRIQVIDTGIGLTGAQCERIFDPFVQADASATRRFGGTGLGLTIVAEIARRLGGGIRVKSDYGRGSTFDFTFEVGPLTDVEWIDPKRRRSQPSQPFTRSTARSPSAHPQLRGRILIAEDSPDNRRLLRKLLERAGLEVDTAEDGAIACERALAAMETGEPFDLILLDIQMPHLDGYQVTARLRERGYRGAIAALTAHATREDREACLSAGFDDYLAKPIERASLIGLVDSHVAKRAPGS